MSDQDEAREGSRIAKVMARAGLCSRRDAEQWIAAGRVSVNGEVLTSPAFNVSGADEILVDGAPLPALERTRLFLFHKPRGLVTTARDPEGRPTIFDALPSELPRVVAIGRLDINTEGLLLLSNDGGLARVLELPATGWLRRYRVRAHGEVTQDQLDALKGGVSIDGVDYLGIEAKFERQQGSNVWLTMGLREGKNREIKRVLEHMGLSVNRLIRVSFGPFELGDLGEGDVAEVRTKVLRDQLGPKLAKQAGANFDAPLETEAAPPTVPPRRGRSERPEREPPRGDLPPRKRKHVSVLRAEAREEAAGPRKRITRATTADRRGREVQIERVSLAKPPTERPLRAERRAPGEGFSRDHAPRRENFGERSAAARSAPGGDRPRREHAPRAEGARPFRPHAERSEGADRPPRRFDSARQGEDRPRRDDDRPFRPRAERSESAARPPRRFETAKQGEDRPRRDGDRPSRPRAERSESAARPPRRFETANQGEDRPRREGDRPFRPRAERSESAARPPRRFETAKQGEDRPRREGDRPFRPRAERSEGAARPSRRLDAARQGEDRPRRDGDRPFRPRAERSEGAARPPRREGAPARRPSSPADRKSGPRSPGGRPGGGKPGGRPPRAPR